MGRYPFITPPHQVHNLINKIYNMNKETVTEVQVKESNLPPTNQERVLSTIDKEIIRIDKLRRIVNKDENWNIKQFDYSDYDFFDFINPDSMKLENIQNWLNVEIDVDELMEHEWESNWENIVSGRLYNHDSSDFDFIYTDWLDDSSDEKDDLIKDRLRKELR